MFTLIVFRDSFCVFKGLFKAVIMEKNFHVTFFFYRVMATVKVSKANSVIWSSDMSYVAILAKHCKSFWKMFFCSSTLHGVVFYQKQLHFEFFLWRCSLKHPPLSKKNHVEKSERKHCKLSQDFNYPKTVEIS